MFRARQPEPVESIDIADGRPSGGARMRVAIVTPVLDDWECLAELVRRLSAQTGLGQFSMHLVVVDDGSTTFDPPKPETLSGPLADVRVVRLKANQSHQRAIALGLAYVEREIAADYTIVMDSDGEDQPADVVKLLEAGLANPGNVVVARRRRRQEGAGFRAGYALYKMFFRMLTGQPISFGNFAAIPAARMRSVLFSPHIWNHFAATLLRSRSRIVFVDTDRGQRYFGSSRMNFASLVAHGMSAIAVFSDLVISRLILFLSAMFMLLLVAIGGVIVAKIAIDYYGIPDVFIPGYTTNLVLALANLLVTSLLVGFMVILSLLATRTQVAALPSNLLDELTDVVVTTPAPVAQADGRITG